MFVFCFLSGKDIAQSSGESGAWYFLWAEHCPGSNIGVLRMATEGHLVPPACTQGQVRGGWVLVADVLDCA